MAFESLVQVFEVGVEVSEGMVYVRDEVEDYRTYLGILHLLDREHRPLPVTLQGRDGPSHPSDARIGWIDLIQFREGLPSLLEIPLGYVILRHTPARERRGQLLSLLPELQRLLLPPRIEISYPNPEDKVGPDRIQAVSCLDLSNHLPRVSFDCCQLEH